MPVRQTFSNDSLFAVVHTKLTVMGFEIDLKCFLLCGIAQMFGFIRRSGRWSERCRKDTESSGYL